jgi:geranylgeranyl diphosphate synthase, type II
MGSPDFIDLGAYLTEKKAVVDNALDACFSEIEGPESNLIASMRYSLFAGGKRLRPILCLAGAEAVGGKETDVLPVACALELIHTYSLIHDDLPVMDDDDLRRGMPSNHKVFGEAVALLAGDGLLTEAFNLMTETQLTERVPSEALLRVIGLIARASGYRGMIGGQLVDIQSEGKSADSSLVEFIHSHKTGALITASVASGAILGRGNDAQVQSITSYGEKIGLAFQISDDILDIEGNSNAMGKSVGADQQKGKATYPAAIGLSRSKKIRAELVEAAIRSLKIFDRGADPLRQIAGYIVERHK